ncbi:MAG: CpaF family protein, partial [Saccharofermentanales bacterium]
MQTMILSENETASINALIAESVQDCRGLDDDAFRRIISRCVSRGLSGSRYGLKDKADIADAFFSRIRGYDVLQPLIDDPGITEIMVNGPASIFFEKSGMISRYSEVFDSTKHLSDVIARIFATENKSLSENEPIADLRLKDGSRANAALLPVAPDGPILTIRK